MNGMETASGRFNRIISIGVLHGVIFFTLLLSLAPINAKARPPLVSVVDVEFESEGALLSATLYSHRDADAALVLVHGSGQAPRMHEFASTLAARGITVLTYDKRGVGGSGGIYAGPEVGTNNVDPANIDLLAKDAAAAVDALYVHSDRNITIGLLGFSQAGWIIPAAAVKNPRVEFMVIFCGPVVPTLDQLLFQGWTDGNEDFWESHTEVEVRSHPLLNDPDRYRVAAEKFQFVSTDPCDALESLSIPGLWLEGGKDIQVPVGLSIERLNDLKAKGKPYEYCYFPLLGHNVAFGGSPQPVEIAVRWIKER